MIPSKEELKKLAHNIDFIDACKLDCNKCDWQKDKTDCRILAKIELSKEGD
jgi:hypothetical protein